jgi:hypothetical protein
MGEENLQFLKLKVDVSREKEGLLFLVDTGADVSLIKGSKPVGTAEFNPDGRVKVKSVDGSPIETHGAIEAKIGLGSKSVMHRFQLVSKQVDIPCDGVLGRDFFQRARAKICYETRTVVLYGEKYNLDDQAKELGERGTKAGQIRLPPRTECVVRVPVTPDSPRVGITRRREMQKRVILAAALTKVVDGYALMSVLNTTEEETEVPEPVVELDAIEPEWEKC